MAAGQWAVAQRLCDEFQASLSLVDAASGWSLAHLAACHGHVHVLQQLAQCLPAALAGPSTSGATPLFLAAQEGHVAVVQYLLQATPTVADLARASDGTTPFFIACQEGRLLAAKALAPWAQLSHESHSKNTPLHAAILKVG